LLIDVLSQNGDFKGVVEICESCPRLQQDPLFVRGLIRAKLSEGLLTQDSFGEAQKLYGTLPDKDEKLERLIDGARKKLRIVAYEGVDPQDYFGHVARRCSEGHGIETFGFQDPTRMSYVFGATAEFTDSLRSL